MTKQKIWTAVELYTGLKAKSIDIVEDPVVAGTVAVRARIERLPDFHFLIQGGEPRATVSWIRENLEECEFRSWPPTSNAR